MYPPQPPPPGYPPYGYPYAPPPLMMAPPRRSGVPKVVGILAIVFASLGLGWAVLFTFGPYSDIDRWHLQSEMPGMMTWLWTSLGLSVVVFALHLVAGIAAVRYRPSAPRLVTVYAIVAIAFALLDIALTVSLMPSSFDVGHRWLSQSEVSDSVVTPRIVYELMAVVWPLVALILINVRGAREACSGTAVRPQDVF